MLMLILAVYLKNCKQTTERCKQILENLINLPALKLNTFWLYQHRVKCSLFQIYVQPFTFDNLQSDF